MALWRRVSAGFCALVLVAALVVFPPRVCAMSATMAAVGGAVVVSAALVACGIYPYISEDGQTFGEWGAEKLSDLWAQYVSSFEGGSLPSGGTVQTFEQIKAYITGQTLVISRSVWGTLQSFVSWVKQTFSLVNNGDGLNLGVFQSGGIPYFSSRPSDNDLASSGAFVAVQRVGSDLSNVVIGASVDSVYPCYVSGSFSGGTFPYACYLFSHYQGFFYSVFVYPDGRIQRAIDVPLVSQSNYFYNAIYSLDIVSGYPVYDSVSQAESAFLSWGGHTSSTFSGVTADTSILGALPDMAADADYMGLAVAPGTVEGVAATMTPQAVQEIIQQGVEERERPVVTPVEVQLATGVEIDAGTGVITDTSPVVIAPDTFPLSPGDYAIPSLSTVFPFSVPWDIARIFQALGAEPRFPLEDFTFTLDIPFLFGDSPPSVSLSLEGLPQELSTKINDTASLVRNLALIVACVGWLIFITEFIRF